MLGASIVTKLYDAVLPRMKSANTFLDAARMKHGNRSISSTTLGELKSMFNDQLNDIRLPKAGEDFDHALFQSAPRVDLTKMRMDIAVALTTAKSMKYEKARIDFIEALQEISNTRDDLEDHAWNRLDALNAVPEASRTQAQQNERLKLLHWLDGPGGEKPTDSERLADLHGKPFKASIDVTTMDLGEAIWLKLGNTSVSDRTLTKIDELFFNLYDIPQNPELEAFTITDFPGLPTEDRSLADAEQALDHLIDMVEASRMGDAAKARVLGKLDYFSAHVEKAQACWLAVHQETCDSTDPADLMLNERAAAWLGIASVDELEVGYDSSLSTIDEDQEASDLESTDSIVNTDDLLSDTLSFTYEGKGPDGLPIRRLSMQSYSDEYSYDGDSAESDSDTDSIDTLDLPLPTVPTTGPFAFQRSHSMDSIGSAGDLGFVNAPQWDREIGPDIRSIAPASSYPYSELEAGSAWGNGVIDIDAHQDKQFARAHMDRMITLLFGTHPIPPERREEFDAWHGEDFPIDSYSFGDYDETRLNPKLAARMARLVVGM